MRTLRLTLATTVMLALLGGVGGAASAQEDAETSEPEGSAVLSFTAPHYGWDEVPTVDFDESRRLYRGSVGDLHIDSGDPRLSGTLWTVSNHDTLIDSQGNLMVGIVGMDHEDGAWRGTAIGYGSPYFESGFYDQLVLTGEGAYEGLSAILFFTANGTGFDVEGMVFPGELPPFPEMQELPVE